MMNERMSRAAQPADIQIDRCLKDYTNAAAIETVSLTTSNKQQTSNGKINTFISSTSPSSSTAATTAAAAAAATTTTNNNNNNSNKLVNGFVRSSKDINNMKDMRICESVEEESPMQSFYKDKGIFLTGGTGFFGKIIIEKLLRVTKVKCIYLLIRTKKGKDVKSRLDDIFNDPVFDKLKSLNKNYREQVCIISGDCSLPGLGIQEEDREMLQQNVDIVIHGAATVRFDEKLKIAIAINVNGTKEMLKLAKEIPKLQAFVHVSTAFAHCNYNFIQEKFYKSPLSGDKACNIAEDLDEQTLNMLTPTIIKDYPNTYTFTKVLAEDIIQNYVGDLPLTVFRPGIVVNTYKEPMPGWIDNMYGPCGIIIGVGSGVLRVFSGNVDNGANMVPVDMCVNALLTSAWDVARNKYEIPPIYNYVPDVRNISTWREFMDYGFKYGKYMPLRKSIWYPRFTIVPYKWQYYILAFLYHTLPAALMDLLMIVIGKKPRMLKIYQKIHKFCSVMEYFSSNEFKFEMENTRVLSSRLEANDKQLFAFDMMTLNWHELFHTALEGLRLYMVKDEPSTIPESIKRNERLKLLHYSTLFIIYSAVFVLFYQLIKFIFL